MNTFTYCIHCNRDTAYDKQAAQMNHAHSGSPWCNQGRPTADDTVAERDYSNRTEMRLGADDEQTECRLISGEIVR